MRQTIEVKTGRSRDFHTGRQLLVLAPVVKNNAAADLKESRKVFRLAKARFLQ